MKTIMASRLFSRLAGTLAALCMVAAAPGAMAGHGDEITVAYFLEWPSPNLASKADGTFDKEMGAKGQLALVRQRQRDDRRDGVGGLCRSPTRRG